MEFRSNFRSLIPVAGILFSILSMHLLRLASALSVVSLAAAWTTYIVPHSSGSDDTPALTAAFSSNNNLASGATILFQKGVTYNILTPIKFPKLQNVIVSVEGNITYAADIKKTQGENPKPLNTTFLALTSAFTRTSNCCVLGRSFRASLKSTCIEHHLS